MNTTQRKGSASNGNHNNRTQWPEPVKFEYHDDFSDEKIKEIREAAQAPSEDDPKWKVVEGPAW